MQPQQQQPQTDSHSNDEQILVVKCSSLFVDGSWQGLKETGLDSFLTIVNNEQEFHPRSLMETDPRYKQIIPYLVFCHNDTYFLMQRDDQSSEQRLKNKYSLGIGGHMRKEDLLETNIIGWAQREFNEEIDYEGSYSVTTLGILNDDSNAVGKVHIGCVLLLRGDSPSISVKSELKSGKLVALAECEIYYPQMERWSQIIMDALKKS